MEITTIIVLKVKDGIQVSSIAPKVVTLDVKSNRHGDASTENYKISGASCTEYINLFSQYGIDRSAISTRL